MNDAVLARGEVLDERRPVGAGEDDATGCVPGQAAEPKRELVSGLPKASCDIVRPKCRASAGILEMIWKPRDPVRWGRGRRWLERCPQRDDG